ncbi:MAG: hypothetical protein IIB83_06310, partial [Bacteroidetes bacterium]|nr:hypothetical protein [Bacteroidota bacterium]
AVRGEEIDSQVESDRVQERYISRNNPDTEILMVMEEEIKRKKMKVTKVKILQGLTPSAIDVIGKRVLIFTYGEEASCLSIKNPEIAQSFRTFFETMWKIAK